MINWNTKSSSEILEELKKLHSASKQAGSMQALFNLRTEIEKGVKAFATAKAEEEKALAQRQELLSSIDSLVAQVGIQ